MKFTNLFKDLADLNKAANEFIMLADHLADNPAFNIIADYDIEYVETSSGQKPVLITRLEVHSNG